MNINNILDKLKDILSQELGDKKIYDKDVATALEINYDTFRKQKQYNKVPYYEIMSFLAKRNISINWFFFNQLPESLIEPTSNYIILKYQKSVISSAGGGAINYDIKTEPLIIDKQLLDYINSSYKYTEVIKTFGESMEPDIKDGSLIFLDKSKKEIDSTNIYVINTPDGTFIKKLNIYNDKVYLKSNNQAYNDIWFKIDEVDIVGRVCGVLFKL
ncbi:LexA family transcriptional repressor [Malaciobacter marinus]|uniref:LexA family transcriptional repressor n=2 Tax=Malaciobacter marinus TaxID=505249 RepID=A0ABX4M0F9_9BACT|nr:LexA family transcriptional repressor [Malaciobacter marinus]